MTSFKERTRTELVQWMAEFDHPEDYVELVWEDLSIQVEHKRPAQGSQGSQETSAYRMENDSAVLEPEPERKELTPEELEIRRRREIYGLVTRLIRTAKSRATKELRQSQQAAHTASATRHLADTMGTHLRHLSPQYIEKNLSSLHPEAVFQFWMTHDAPTE